MTIPPSADDTELFASLRQGDPGALDALFRRHYASLCRVSVRFVGQPAAAEDIVQETFAKLWARRHTLPADATSIGAYLRRSVRNRSLNYLRDRKRIPVDEGELPPTATTDSLHSPIAALEQEEQRHRINQAIDRLPERCRLVFVMNKIEDMSQREIAEQLGISVKTVENQMTRAYRYLRQWLAIVLLIISTGNV